jgi:hypothetical protein
MDYGVSGLRSEEEYFRILKNRMIECICEEATVSRSMYIF